MDERVRITVEIDSAEHAALSDIASHTGKSLDQVAASALRIGIAEQCDFDAAMAEGRADMEAGRIISNEESLVRAAARRENWFARQTG